MEHVFAIYDLKGCHYGQPFMAVSKGVALRIFSDACADSRSTFSKHPGDFVLHMLGTWDPNTGRYENLRNPEIMYTAGEVIQQLVEARRRAIDKPVEPQVEGPKQIDRFADLTAATAVTINSEEIKQ